MSISNVSTEDGQVFVKHLAYFVRTHEKALANALQIQRKTSGAQSDGSASSALAAAFSLATFNFSSPAVKPAKLTLTPHHLYYLLSSFETLGIPVGSMNVRLENIHCDSSPTNYVSFLGQAPKLSKRRGSDRDSIHSVFSVKSVVSMSVLWSSLSLSNSAAKQEKQKAQTNDDLKYLYSSFTKIPCLRLAPDHKSRLISGFEEFPFDTAVPLFVFKNLSVLEICDFDFRQFFGWDRLADQLRSLTVKRGNVEDVTDLLTSVVLDDVEKRRRRSCKTPSSPTQEWPTASPTASPARRHAQVARSTPSPDASAVEGRRPSDPSSEGAETPGAGSAGSTASPRPRQRSVSPVRPAAARHGSYGYLRGSGTKMRRASNSSGSSLHSSTPRNSSLNLLSLGFPSTKWQFLRHLSLADNGLTTITSSSLAPLVNTLQSLDLSSNLFTEIPEYLSSLVALRALNLSNCMIETLHSLGRNPLPAITTLTLRSNRLISLAGIHRLLSLEQLDLRDNRFADPVEIARLTGIPELREIYVSRNPFVRTHPNYRVTIFNLFRSAPGYSEDIIIDGSGPGYSEKRHLVDRAPERASLAVARPPPNVATAEGIADIEKGARHCTGGQAQTGRAEPISPIERLKGEALSRPPANSQRRRKGARRRIVELSQGDGGPTQPFDPASPEFETRTSAQQGEHGSLDGSLDSTASRAESSELSNETRQSPNQGDGLPRSHRPEGQDETISGLSGELYRKRMESLKNDMGQGWLSAIEGHHHHHHHHHRQSGEKDTRPHVRQTNSQRVTATRTLG